MRAITALFLILFVCSAALTAVDVYLYFKYGVTATISWELQRLACQAPIVATVLGFAVGVIFGHVFWPLDAR